MSTDKNNIEVELTGFSGYELKHSKEVDEEIHALVQVQKRESTLDATGTQSICHQNLETCL